MISLITGAKYQIDDIPDIIFSQIVVLFGVLFRSLSVLFFSHLHGSCSFISINESIIVGINKFKGFLIKVVVKKPMLKNNAMFLIHFFQTQHIVPIIVTGTTDESDLGFNAGIVRKVEFSIQRSHIGMGHGKVMYFIDSADTITIGISSIEIIFANLISEEMVIDILTNWSHPFFQSQISIMVSLITGAKYQIDDIPDIIFSQIIVLFGILFRSLSVLFFSHFHGSCSFIS